MIRIVFISDLHFDAHTDGFARFDDVKDSLQAAVDHAKETKADALVACGDFCDPDAGDVVYRMLEVLEGAALECSSHGIFFFAEDGNHDVVEDGSGTSTLTPLRPLEGVTAGRVRVFESPGVAFLDEAIDAEDLGKRPGASALLAFLPYPSRAREYDPEKALQDAAARARAAGVDAVLVVSHLNVKDLEVSWRKGSEDDEMARGRRKLLPDGAFLKTVFGVTPMRVIQGHYHEPLDLDGEQGHKAWYVPLHVVGSPERLTHGEERKACSLLEVTVDHHGVIRTERLGLESREVCTVTEEDFVHANEVAADHVVKGALVRYRPYPGNDGRAERDALLTAGASAVRIEASTPRAPGAPKEERGRVVKGETHRQVAERLASALPEVVREGAVAEVARIATEEKL